MIRALPLVLLAGCQDRTPTSPAVAEDGTLAICQECPLIIDMRPLHASAVRHVPAMKDSADTRTYLGEFTIIGDKAGEVLLDLSIGDSALTIVGNRVFLQAEIVPSGAARQWSLEDLIGGMVVHRFAEPGAITVRYYLTRTVGDTVTTDIRLVQRVDDARVEVATMPWSSADARPVASLTEGEPCSATVPDTQSSGVFCGVSVAISPHVTGGPFGGFQSDPGTGPSSTITISFSPSVTSVTLTALDPDFAGNQLVAFDAGGSQVASSAFAIDNTPGEFTSSTVTVSAPEIATVQAVPGSNDYVAYSGLTLTAAAASADLELVCLPAVVERAGIVECEAAAPGATNLEIRAWEFVGTQIDLDEFPMTVALLREVDASSGTWTGRIVIPGLVMVTAVVDDSVQNAVTSIDVSPRDWTNTPIDSTIQEVISTLPLRPTRFHGAFGRAVPWLPPDLESFAVVNDNGPNHLLVYQTAMPFSWFHPIQINDAAMSDSSDFWLLQPATPGPGECSREFLTDEFPLLVRAHEGTGWEANSHVVTFHSALRTFLPQLGEQLAGFDPGQVPSCV